MTEIGAIRRRGRPRSSECDEAILAAALRLLEEVGYVRMSMEGVASTAGVSKPTIYLRYSSKAELVAAAMERLHIRTAPVPTGDLRADLVALLALMRANADRVSVMSLVGTCLAEQEHTPELLPLYRERTLGPRRRQLRAILERARSEGGLSPAVDLDTVVDMLMGAYHARFLSGEPFPEGWEERVVDAILDGLRAG